MEFGLIAMALVTLMLGCLQFGLYFVAGLQIRSALAESTAYSLSYGFTRFRPEARDPTAIRNALCAELVLAMDCSARLKLEQVVLATLPSERQPIAGTQFVEGVPGELLVRRAEVAVVTFVPGVQPLSVRSSSIWLRR